MQPGVHPRGANEGCHREQRGRECRQLLTSTIDTYTHLFERRPGLDLLLQSSGAPFCYSASTPNAPRSVVNRQEEITEK